MNLRQLGLDPPTQIRIRNDTNWNIRREMGRLSEEIILETIPRCYQVGVIEFSAVRAIPCNLRGTQLTGLEMVKRFHCERRLGERLTKACGIVFGLKDEYDLRHYVPVDARACRYIHNVEGVFDKQIELLGLQDRVYGKVQERRLVRFFLDGTVFSLPTRSQQWIACSYRGRDEEGNPAYRCSLCRADLVRGKYDFSLVMG